MSHPTVSLLGCLLLLASGAGCAVATDTHDAPPEPAVTQAWDAESVTEEALSTHLWITNNAISLLAHRSDVPGATRMAAFMNLPACRVRWQQGLIDADFLAAYDDGWSDTRPGDSTTKLIASGASWKSHFYDPDTQANYKGGTDRTARTEAAKHLSAAASGWSAQRPNEACYELGLALHYMTDITQPMHASNFTATTRMFLLHTNVEHYSMAIQARFALTDAAAIGQSSATPDATFIAAAHASKALWPAMLQAIDSAYQKRGAVCAVADNAWVLDKASCWEGDAGVDAQVGVALASAQKATAQYLSAASSLFPVKK